MPKKQDATVKVTANVPVKLHGKIRKEIGKRGLGPLIVQLLEKRFF